MRKYMLLAILLVFPGLECALPEEPVKPEEQEEQEIGLLINGEPVVTETPPLSLTVQDKEIIYMPARLTAEKVGFETWAKEDPGELGLVLGSFTVSTRIGSRYVLTSGNPDRWGAPVLEIEGTVYWPAFAAAQTMGVLARWDEAEQVLNIKVPASFDPPGTAEGPGPLLHVAFPSPADPFYYYGESLFVFGTTSSFSFVEVTVNGEAVDLIDPRSGNFLTMVDIKRGEETLLTVEATGDGGSRKVERNVLYPTWWTAMPPEPLAMHPDRFVPAARQVLGAGDILQVAFQGSPGGEALFQLGTGAPWQPMTERAYPGGPPGTGGIYTASYRIEQDDLAGPDPVTLPLTVVLRRDGEEVRRTMAGAVRLIKDDLYKVLEVRSEPELKNRGWLYSFDPGRLQLLAASRGGAGYPSSVVRYLVEGTRFPAVGSLGEYYRVAIAGNRNYLVHRDAVFEPERQFLAEARLDGIEVIETTEKISLRLQSGERFPFFVDDGLSGLKVNLPGVMVPDEVQWQKSLTEAAEGTALLLESGRGKVPGFFSVKTNFMIKGFQTRWAGTDLVIDLYKPVPVNREDPLQGRVIIVDPGHGGDDRGAAGPGHLDEKDVVLAMSLHLRDMLKEAGAEVIMTRTEDIDVNLYDRPVGIDDYNADLFISVHANAHAHDAPATDIHGLMILYNYAHNEQLADIMLETMVRETALPEFRTWRRNIAVLRHPQVPSVLVEAGYMMHPHDNWYILHPDGQKELAGAMLEGIKNYFLAAGR